MAVLVCLVMFLALTAHSSALYCVCKDGVGDQTLQKTIDYACGSGADCSAILQNGACYQPNTVKDHCNYAANSYFQKKGQVTGSCDFSGTATTTSTVPNQASGCVYPTSASTATSTTPSSLTPSTSTGTTPSVIGLAPTGINDFSSAGVPQSFNLVVFCSLALGFFWFSGSLLLWG